MKPRTKIEKEVWALYNRTGYLRNNRMNPAFMEWVRKTYRMNEASCVSRKAWCSECGESFDVPKGATKVTCPHCGAELDVVKTRRQKIVNDANYIQELTTCGAWQIIKTYHVETDCHKGYKAGCYIHKCYEKWLDEEGHEVVISRPMKSLPNWQRIPWSRRYHFKKNGSEWDWYGGNETEVAFSLKNPNAEWYSGWNIQHVYPQSRIQPWLRRYGLTKDTHGLDFGDLAKQLPNSPAETYWKAGQVYAGFLLHVCGQLPNPRVRPLYQGRETAWLRL